MLELTPRHELEPTQPGLTGTGLILLPRTPDALCRWIPVPDNFDVFFGSEVSDDPEEVNALAGMPLDPRVSPCHARVWFDVDEGAHVIDLCSASGTWLNGCRITPNRLTLVRSGDVIGVGASRFVWLAATPRPTSRRPAQDEWLSREAFADAYLDQRVAANAAHRPLALLVFAVEHTSRSASAAVEDDVGRRIARAWRLLRQADSPLCRIDRKGWAILLPGTEMDKAVALARALGALLACVWAVAKPPVRARVHIGVAPLAGAGVASSLHGEDDEVILSVSCVEPSLDAARQDRNGRRS